MSVEKTTNSERWTVELRDQDIQPCGSEDSLRKAVERLGPFKQRLNVDAERFGPWGGAGNRIPLSEEYAIEQVWQLAVGYNKQAQLEQRAPRLKHVVDALSTLEQLAGELAQHITSLDDISRHLLKTAGTGLGRFLEDWTKPLIEAADVAGLPNPGPEKDPCLWVRRLESLSQYTNQALGTFLESKGITDVDVPDKGGKTNLYLDIYGSAQWSFVNQGWHIHETFKVGTSTAQKVGHFTFFFLMYSSMRQAFATKVANLRGG